MASTLVRVGDAPVSHGRVATAEAASARVVLTADARGHFMPQGQINGRAVQFLVDIKNQLENPHRMLLGM